MRKYDLPISPRSNTLITGPTGTGKTHLARIVAEESGAKFFAISALEWIPTGATGRGAEITWVQITSFLNKGSAASKQKTSEDEPFLIIFLDEVDKLSAATDSSWQQHIKTECFKLLDHQIPEGIKDEFDDSFSEEERIKLQHILKHRTLILAAGAFQPHWESKSRSTIGFADPSAHSKNIELHEITETIERELANRFRSETIQLPELGAIDYENILSWVAEELPVHLKKPFLSLGRPRIAGAVQQRTGFRFAEEVLLDALMMEQIEDAPKALDWKRYPPNSSNLRCQYYDPRDTPEIL